jgi:hypothetical protein
MARDKHSGKDNPRPRDAQKADVQKAYGSYSATEQGDSRRAHEQPAADATPDPVAPDPVAPGPAAPRQEAERGAYDPDHEYRRYERPDRKPEAQPKAGPKTPPKRKGAPRP